MESLKSLINAQLDKLGEAILASLNKVAIYLKEQGGLIKTSQIWGSSLGGYVAKVLTTLLIWLSILLGAGLLLVGNLVIIAFEYLEPKVKAWYLERQKVKVTLDLETTQSSIQPDAGLNKKFDSYSLKELIEQVTDDNSHPEA